MALLAKRLPVLLVPEQRLISPVWSDVIHNRCRSQFSVLLTLCAKRILCQKPFSRHLPALAVTPFKRARPITSVNFGVKFAILAASQTGTAGMLARFLGLHWHVLKLPLRKEKPSKALLQGSLRFHDFPMI